MAIQLEAAYSKKLGLPGFSSHSYVVSVRTELTDLSQVEEESNRLYGMLQAAVDKEMQHPGFVPDEAYGMDGTRQTTNGHSRNGNGHSTGNGYSRNGSGATNGNGNSRQSGQDSGISEKQISLIEDIIKQNNARKGDVENMAVDMFGGGIRTLNRMQASNFIDALFEKYPRQPRNNSQRQTARS